MSIDNPTFQLPRTWTAEQADFLCALLEDLTHVIWETYEDDLLRLWRDQDGHSLPGYNQRDQQPEPLSIPPPDPDLLCPDDDDIPW